MFYWPKKGSLELPLEQPQNLKNSIKSIFEKSNKLKDEIKKSTKLGTQESIVVASELSDSYSRVLVRTSDHGVLGSSGQLETSGRDNADSAKSFSRYNLLFTQALNILIPCNTKLKVGDIILCGL